MIVRPTARSTTIQMGGRVGSRVQATETISTPGTGLITTTITYTCDDLYRLTEADYSSGENFQYAYDAVGNRTSYTATITSTQNTTYAYDAANRMTKRVVDGSDRYTYTWSDADRLTSEEWNGYIVRTFAWDAAGRLAQATVPGFTTTFRYDGDGHRLIKVVNGDPVTYTLDSARNVHILVERAVTSTRYYLYGQRCIAEQNEQTKDWSYYLADGAGRVRQVADEAGQVDSAWSYTVLGEVLSGPKGLHVLLKCPDGVYDWSTGLVFSNGRYFDPALGIWLSLLPLMFVSGYINRGKRNRRKRLKWGMLLFVVLVLTLVAGCDDPPSACIPEFAYERDPSLRVLTMRTYSAHLSLSNRLLAAFQGHAHSERSSARMVLIGSSIPAVTIP